MPEYSNPTKKNPFWNFNIGHIITMVVFLGGMITSYVHQQEKVVILENRLAALEGVNAAENQKAHEVNEKLFTLVNDIRDRMAVMENDIGWMKKKPN